ncbi:MAG: hypothetical protein AUH92_03455 [Acidobacteria bacterium 13_1_40CM_4_69_4]|nr:MAG: hypothetical protein AUH92_03455 [Acidobacteria bacterium 13_1_40CM_4_69_4]
MNASAGDRVLLLGLLAFLAAAASASPIRSFDYWWHLKTGEIIVRERLIPRVDPFSFTAPGVPWVDHEWLFQALAYIGHTTLGPGALVGVKVALVVLLAFLMVAHLRRERNATPVMAILLAAALVGASFRLDVRPELATLLLLPVVVHLVLRARDGGRHRLLLAVPLLVAFGSNLHPGAILAPAILLLGAAATCIDERLGFLTRAAGSDAAVGARFAPRLAAAAAASALACGANPYGFTIYAVPFQVSRILASLPSPNLEWAHPRVGDFPFFFLAAAAVLAALAASWRWIDPVAAPALVLLLVLSVMHLRNIGLFFVLLPYGLARPARALTERVGSAAAALLPGGLSADRPAAAAGGGVRPGFVAAAVVLFSAVPLLVVLPPTVAWGIGPAPGNEPALAVDFVDRENVGRRLYNDVRFGGYLIWRRFPGHRVFIDGRNEVYPALLREIFAASSDSRAWQALLQRYDIDSAFVRYSPTLERVIRPGTDGGPGAVRERAFSADHFPAGGWALVYWDDDAMIFLRRSEENEPVIARHEYRAIQPEDWRYQLAGVITGHTDVGPIVEELQRKVREDPHCARARELLKTFNLRAQAHDDRGGAPPAGG